jgi:hypothetical protein
MEVYRAVTYRGPPHCLDNRLTDAGEVVSLTRQPRSTPNEYFLVHISIRGRVNQRPSGL